MLTGFEVANFKSIKHLDIELRPFMVLVGPNGAGKTNFVQALDLFGAILGRGTIEPVRELGYDELIRREKKPARGGLLIGGRFTQGSAPLVRGTLVGKDLFAPQANPEVTIRLTLQIRGSVKSNAVRLAQEHVVIERSDGRFTLDRVGAEPITTGVTGDDSFRGFLAHALLGSTRAGG